MKVLILDSAEKGILKFSWMLGAWLYKYFDIWLPVTSWEEAKELEKILNGRKADEIQYWGHGWEGKTSVDHQNITPDVLDSLSRCVHKDSYVWFRCCGTFHGEAGQSFAKYLANTLQCKVMSHTYRVTLWHSGLNALMPGQEPYWPIQEGEGTDKDEKAIAAGGPDEPKTIIAFRMKPPDWV